MSHTTRFRFALMVAAGVLPSVFGWSGTPVVPAPADVGNTTLPPDSPQWTARAQTLFADANGFWSQEFMSLGGQYRNPTLALFNKTIKGACSAQGSLSGSFYCPADQKVYLDQTFPQQVAAHSTGTGDEALAYLIGHEVGHHVQDLLGTTESVEQARSRSTPQVSARTWATEELQTDCYAGLWLGAAVKRGKIKLDADVSAMLDAVAAVSQEQATHLAAGQLVADPVLTYGTPAQRLKWFRRGLDNARFGDCDTFGAEAAGQL
jgi:predicted metalloprotease